MAQTILTRLTENINAVVKEPSVALDRRLFEEAELVLADTLEQQQNSHLVTALASLLPDLQQDPTPAVNLLLRLVPDYTFADILHVGKIPFSDGLAVGDHMVSFNRLIIVLLSKATLQAADAAAVAGMLDTVLALVRLWLSTADTGISSQASRLLIDLLRVDQEIHSNPDVHLPTGGQGLVWKRIFGDRDVYRTFFDVCSLTGPVSIKLSKGQRTLGQARLLEWLPQVAAMDWNVMSRSHHPDIEKEFSVEGGLLDFAAIHMVDAKDDVLMHRCLVDFYSDLLRSTKPSMRMRIAGAATDSPGLRYLISGGLHAKTGALYLQLPNVQLDALEAMFLYGPAANYIATYASQYPEHFMASQLPSQVMDRLKVALALSPARWAHSESPKHDLHLLASLPRRAIFASTSGLTWSSSPLSLLPSKATNPDVLNTLATIFHGPNRDILVFPSSEATASPANGLHEEAAEARSLYYHYVANNQRFWNDIATHADVVALKDTALASLNCLTAVITANWSARPEIPLPTIIATPESGHLAILSPPALEHALPYLLKPPQTFANLVGGRGDAESSAYQIAQAKFDALRALSARLTTQVEKQPGHGYEEILATVNKRLIEVPLSRDGEVGGRIGTLEL